MGYRLTAFAGVTLPTLDAEDDTSVAEARSGLVELAGGGWYDSRGASQAERRPALITVRRAVVESSTTTMRMTINALRALIGYRASLWREWGDGTTEYCTARLLACPGRDGSYDNRMRSDVGLIWERTSAAWYSEVSRHIEEPSLPGGGSGFETFFNNAGNRWTLPVLTVTAGTTAISAVTITNVTNGHAVSWAGKLDEGDALIIDCAAQSVTVAGIDAYADFTRPDAETWLALEAGTNELAIDITYDGATEDATFNCEYDDAWE